MAIITLPVTFDFQHPKGMDYLQFGNVKMSQQKTLMCTLKNKGKFPAKYKITFDPKIFDVQPNEGRGMSISDKMSGTTTSLLPIPFSCDASYSQFSWVSGRAVNFGIVPNSPQILQRKHRVSFTITNPKPFPCVIDLSIKGKNGGPRPFEPSEKSVSLDASSSPTIGITFRSTMKMRY